MQPYIVLRRLKRGRVIDDIGDYEYFIGHCARRWLFWRGPYPRWERGHLPHHEELKRFDTTVEANAYIYAHDDMGIPVNEMIEMVPVVCDPTPFWEKEAPFD